MIDYLKACAFELFLAVCTWAAVAGGTFLLWLAIQLLLG
jgi:hypothetical protein